MTADDPQQRNPGRAPRPGPRPGPRPSPRPPPHPIVSPPASDPHRFGRVDDDGTVWLISAAGERVIGSWQAGDAEAAFAHFGRRFDDLSTEVTLHGGAAGVGHRRRTQDQSYRSRRSPKRCRRRMCSAMSMRWPRGWPASVSGPTPSPPPTGPDATNIAPPRPRAKRRWPPKPRSWPPPRRSGKPPATGCARFSTNGRRSAAWTAKPTTRCGSAIPRPGKRSTGGADRISPSWTANGRVPARPRSGSARSAEELVESTDWGATSAEFRKLLDRLEGRRAARPATSTTRCGAVSKPPRTPSSRRVTPPPPSETRNCRPTPTPKRRCWREAEKLDTSNQEAARAALRSIGDKWDAIGKVPRERSADLERRLRAVEKKVRDAGERFGRPAGSGPRRAVPVRAEQFERQAQKAAAAGRSKEAEEARANAEQWRQWADAAAEALTRRP